MIQFQGRTKKINITPKWKAKVEPKCRIFAWILLHRNILIADNLEKRGWPNDPICKLCNWEPKTLRHLCKDCTYYTTTVWSCLATWFHLHHLPTGNMTSSIYAWWKRGRKRIERQNRQLFDDLIIYFWWNIWKEQNRRTFNQTSKTFKEVAFLTKEDVQKYQLAKRRTARNSTQTFRSCCIFLCFSLSCTVVSKLSLLFFGFSYSWAPSPPVVLCLKTFFIFFF